MALVRLRTGVDRAASDSIALIRMKKCDIPELVSDPDRPG
jgi:hypothetical protein